ncbi:rhodanese-like domain-containing protein [Nocardioides sp. zg-DK7169]|uniref:rhodanese-like domain-containing protein n=1 Tax=Nocardioides sp. zg-DK7169 TaxID=2736600 RepID=UPI0015566382|nr:rhodanese-like domain-containing protein [Nocardioides sp. zg-DK7169]NPC95529.1 hypothetical protein [Nocardioides sp. zg-DK7169]
MSLDDRRDATPAPPTAVAPRPARQVTAEEVTDAVLSGSWVIDLRERARFADAHVPGSVNVEWSEQFATHVGWLVPWHDDIVLLTDSPALLEPALRALARIGVDGVGTHVLPPEPPPASYRRATWADYLAAQHGDRSAEQHQQPARPRVLLDVREAAEHEQAHLPGAVHVPLHDVERVGPLLPSGELWVHCRSGHLAGIAASLLQRLGRAVVHIDDGWDRVADLAVPHDSAA